MFSFGISDGYTYVEKQKGRLDECDYHCVNDLPNVEYLCSESELTQTIRSKQSSDDWAVLDI
jgi:hypothetical protein